MIEEKIYSFLKDESSLTTERASLAYVEAGRVGARELTIGDNPEQRIRLITYFVAAYFALC